MIGKVSTEGEPVEISLSNKIIAQLSEVREKSTFVSGQLSELEKYIFGDKPSNMSDETVSSSPSCWKEDVLYVIDQINSIIAEQERILHNISKFHK